MESRPRTLEELLADGRALPAGRVAAIGLAILDVLARRHAVGELHGALSPSAVRMTGDEVELVSAPAAMHYQAPEQLDGLKPTPMADVFGCAAVLYRALTGRLPFPGRNLVEVVDAHLAGAEPVLSIAPSVPDGLARLVDRALARRPEARFADVDRMRRTLQLLELAAPPPAPLPVPMRASEDATWSRAYGPDVTLFDRFLILGVIRRGGWDALFLVKDTAPAQPRMGVLRLGQPGFAAARTYLAHEVQVVAELKGRHVIEVIDHGSDEELPWTLYMSLRGPSLRTVMLGETVSPDATIDVIVQLLDALRTVHTAGWVHRDVKPDNFLEESPGAFRLASFDLATRAGPWPGTELVGSPRYMAPETITGGPLSTSSDIYAAGAIFFELLAGRPPYTADSLPALCSKIVMEPAPPLPPSSSRPPYLDAVVRKALAKRPEDRFASAPEMIHAVLGQVELG